MSDTFEGWAIVELMGHRRLAGYVSEQEVASSAMLRLDIPSEPPVTQFYSASALYCMTPTTEEIARGFASRVRPAPVQRYELPAAPAAVPDIEDDDPDDECGGCGRPDYECICGIVSPPASVSQVRVQPPSDSLRNATQAVTSRAENTSTPEVSVSTPSRPWRIQTMSCVDLVAQCGCPLYKANCGAMDSWNAKEGRCGRS